MKSRANWKGFSVDKLRPKNHAWSHTTLGKRNNLMIIISSSAKDAKEPQKKGITLGKMKNIISFLTPKTIVLGSWNSCKLY